MVDYTWSCEKKDNTRDCLVNYTIKNNDDFVQQATVKIRAHKRRRVDDALSNEIVGENAIVVKLAPKEEKSQRHNIILNRKLTQIVVSAYVSK